ncbi:hypothetical protein M9458_045167, partial [Cirrhinus mrigala]
MQKELAHRDEKEKKKEECEEKVTAPHRSTNSFDVFIFPHVPSPYHHYPVAELQALKVDPDLDCSPPRRQTAPPARPSALPARPAVPHPQAAAAGGQEEEEDPEMIPETPNKEADEKRTCRLPPTKKRKTRNTVKEGNVNITAPMVKVSRPDGVMVFRPWTLFPACVDTSRIGNCCQTREESVQDYYHRLYETFNKHSSLEEPDDRGNQPGTWECHLRSWFLNRMRPEIAQAVKGNYIEWKNGYLTAILAHALHAEEQQTTKKERVRGKTDKELQPALVQAASRPGGYSAPISTDERGE